MFLPSRTHSWLFAIGPPRRTCLRLLVLPIVVFGVALVLPSFRLQLWGNSEGSYEPGYVMFYWVEGVVIDDVLRLARSVVGASAPVPGIRWGEYWLFYVGAAANHLFALACLATIFRRLRLALILSTLSALCAVGCMLPAQIIDIRNGWHLGPGYFVWCAAPLSMMILTRPGRTK